MTSSRATLVLRLSPAGPSEGERIVSAATRANALDLVEKACGIEEISRIVVMGTPGERAGLFRDYPVVLEPCSDSAFLHFGKILTEVIKKHDIRTGLYMGAGSGVFMEIEEIARMVQAVLNSPEMLLVNNFYSTDFAAWGSRIDLRPLSQCSQDNQLGWALGRVGSVKARVLPSSLATRFDIDTPADVMVLKAHPPRGPHLSGAVSRLPLDLSPLVRVMETLVDRNGQAMITGRIPPEIALFFDRETACHTRFYIEERGMETRREGGRIWSLVGLCVEKLGISQFFRTLATHACAAIIDSRVLFRHLGPPPSRRDRFFSDLLEPDQVENPAVRRFTEEALQSPIPCVLGGHTLVSGGLYALVESAWDRVKEPLVAPLDPPPRGKGATSFTSWKEQENGCF